MFLILALVWIVHPLLTYYLIPPLSVHRRVCQYTSGQYKKYEDGKVMVKDIGAARVKSNNPHSYKIRLVDGWWVCEVPESEYSDFIKYLYFYGENDSWEISYVNGRASIWVSIYEGDSIVNVDIDSIRISVYYSIGDFEYNDFYRNGSLEYHTVDAYYMDEIVAVGHRVLHSGEDFKDSVKVTPDVLKKIEGNIDDPQIVQTHVGIGYRMLKL